MIEVLLILSVLLNVFLGWYGYLLLRKVVYVSGNTSEILTAVDRYQNHLKNVYELETFYGDETLHDLLNHTGDLTTFLIECENAYALTEREFEENVKDNEEEGDTTPDEPRWR
tara:strand:+ start:83 stop:421 length:339 start_codon:yes stop_codon:yes gene_type:complete